MISKRVLGSEASGSKPPPASASPLELGRALEGTSLGHLRLEAFVGGGGMGAVFRAVDTRLGRTVAVKVLSRDRTDSDVLKRFENEAQSAARLDHDNIARVYDVGEAQGLHYIVFEFIEGVNLRDLVLQKGPLPLDEAIGYTLQVASAVGHAAQRNVVHRDIKPSNVLIAVEQRAKLVDMGLARLHQLGSDSHDLTASGVTLGTFDYISPEQARDPRMADVRSDLYSLGCTLYFMLTGQPPFPDGTVLQKLLSHSTEPPVDPRRVRPDLGEGIVKIINKLLAKQPVDRYQQPDELIGELLLLADSLQLSGISRAGSFWVDAEPARRVRLDRFVPWLVPLLLLVGATLLAGHLGWPDGTEGLPARPVELRAAATTTRPRRACPAGAGQPAPCRIRAGGARPAGVARSGPPWNLPPPDDPSPRTAPAARPPVAAPADSGQTAPRTTGAPAAVPASGDIPGGDAATQPKPASDSPPASAAPEAGPARVEDRLPSSEKLPAAQVLPDFLVVGPPDVAVPDNARRVDSLQEAVQEAARSGVSAIELHFDGAREQPPLDMAPSRLTIRAGSGFHPTVLFRPRAGQAAADRHLVRVAGGRLTWAGVHIRVELPPEPAESWAVFHLKQIVSLELRDAVVTVRNLGPQGEPLSRSVAFFELEGPGAVPSGNPGDRPAEGVPPPYLRLSNCLVRGQAGLVRVPQATPVRMVCQQSLLVTTERLLDVQGSPAKPGPKSDPIELELKNVTAVAGQGLCRLSSDASHPYQLDLVARCTGCILYVTDGKVPLLERRGVAAAEDVLKRWTVSGRDNFYPGSTLLLRISPNGNPAAYADYDLEQRDRLGFDEKSPRASLMWATLPDPDRSADLHLPGDYLLDEQRTQSGRRRRWPDPGRSRSRPTAGNLGPAGCPPTRIAPCPIAPPACPPNLTAPGIRAFRAPDAARPILANSATCQIPWPHPIGVDIGIGVGIGA